MLQCLKSFKRTGACKKKLSDSFQSVVTILVYFRLIVFNFSSENYYFEASNDLKTVLYIRKKYRDIQWNPVKTDTKGHAKVFELSGCLSELSGQNKHHGNLFYLYKVLNIQFKTNRTRFNVLTVT